ncbi:hypothetical protein GTW67_01925 [Streptomyces sp. SID5910]|nr:hypothetical protein [Streptomyces sp. SID5910]
MPVHVAPTGCRRIRASAGRCRAYPRKYVRFSPGNQTAGTLVDPPVDWAKPHSASEYAAAHLTAQSTLRTHVGAPSSTRTHPRECRGLGNV